MRGAVLAIVALLGACAYNQQKADLQAGGGARSQALATAQTRLAAAQDKQAGLREDKLSVDEELAALQAEVGIAERNRSVQTGRLARARAQQKITPADETRLRGALDAKTDDLATTAQGLQGARSAGNPGAVQAREAELARLNRDIAQINAEINVLAGN